MSKLVTPHQMELQAEAFKTYLDSGGDWALRGDEATFSPTYKNEGLPVTVKGVNNVDNFAFAGTTITVPSAAYDTDTQISVNGEGYTFTSNDIINVAVKKGTVNIFNAPSTVKVDGENTCVDNVSASDVVLFGETCAGSSVCFADDVSEITASADNIYFCGGATNSAATILPHENAVTEGITISGGGTIDLSQDTILSGEETLHGAHVIENNDACISIKGFTASDSVQVPATVDAEYVKANSSIIGANYLDIHNTLYFVGLSAASNISLAGMSGGTAIHLMDKNGNVIYPEFCIPKAVTFTDADEIVTLNSEFSGYIVDMRGGNDTVVIDGAADLSLNTGTGADSVSISSGSGECTIFTGAGQDTIHNSNTTKKHVYQLTGNDGDKVIYGFTNKDYLQIMDDSTFTPTVFAPTDSECVPVSIGNVRASIQGNLYTVPYIGILDKNGNLISSNTVGRGVIFKNPDVELSGNFTVPACNCLVTNKGSGNKIYNDCGGVIIYTSNSSHSAVSINSTYDGDVGNTYVFNWAMPATNGTIIIDTVSGFKHENDSIYCNFSGAIADVSPLSPAITCSGNDLSDCKQLTLSTGIFKSYKSYYYFKLLTLNPFYGNTFSYYRRANGTSASYPLTGYNLYTATVSHSLTGASLINNDKIKTLTYTGGKGVIQKFANGTLNSNAPVTIEAEGGGSVVTMKGGIVQAEGCNVNNCSANVTIEGDNNRVVLSAASLSAYLADGVSGCKVFGSNNGDTIIANGAGNTLFGCQATNGYNTTITGFDPAKDTFGVNGAWADFTMTIQTVEGGVRFQAKSYKNYSYCTLLGVSTGVTLKYVFNNGYLTTKSI